VCGSVQFWLEQICAVIDSVSEQQRSVRSISNFCDSQVTQMAFSSNGSTVLSVDFILTRLGRFGRTLNGCSRAKCCCTANGYCQVLHT